MTRCVHTSGNDMQQKGGGVVCYGERIMISNDDEVLNAMYIGMIFQY